jgi:hypothetical protein
VSNVDLGCEDLHPKFPKHSCWDLLETMALGLLSRQQGARPSPLTSSPVGIMNS